jgi:UTP--glucose-1-phosphate uridylyltransferase
MAFQFSGRRYDCGSKLGYLQATVELGTKHAEVGPGFAKFLRERGSA